MSQGREIFIIIFLNFPPLGGFFCARGVALPRENHEVLTTEWEPEGQAQRSKFKRIKISRPNEKIILLDLNRFVRFLREVHSPRTPLANKVLNKEKNSRNSRNSH